MPRLLAIDYGLKRVGIAVTDDMQMIASPLETVHNKDILTFLNSYFLKENVSTIVVGEPKKLDGSFTDLSVPVQNFVKHLKKQFPDKSIILHDERFTSKMALDAMISGGTKKKDRRKKGNLDKVSACIILQSYLESNH